MHEFPSPGARCKTMRKNLGLERRRRLAETLRRQGRVEIKWSHLVDDAIPETPHLDDGKAEAAASLLTQAAEHHVRDYDVAAYRVLDLLVKRRRTFIVPTGSAP